MMSLWDELLSKVEMISCDLAKNIQEGLDLGLAALNEFEKDTLNARLKVNKTKPNKLGAINESEKDDATPPKSTANSKSDASSKPATDKVVKDDPASSDERSDAQQENERSGSKKRGKDELRNGTPEQDKRHKRTASVRAQNIISKQVNVNLTQKLRRPQDDEDKENTSENIPLLVQVKQEKISMVAEPVQSEWEAPPVAAGLAEEKEGRDTAMMPPPPATKTRGTRRKPQTEVVKTEPATDELPSRRSTRTRKQTDVAPPSSDGGARPSTRASARLMSTAQEEMPPPPPPERRPTRTRTRKQLQSEQATTSEAETSESEKPQEEAADVSEKPRHKRTRKARKGGKSESDTETKTEERPMSPPVEKVRAEKNQLSSPVISAPAKKMKKSIEKIKTAEKITTDKLVIEKVAIERIVVEKIVNDIGKNDVIHQEAKNIIPNSNETSIINDSIEIFEDQRKTIELLSCASIDKVEDDTDNAENKDEPQQKTACMNETIVLSKAPAMNETVTLSTAGSGQMTNDSSLMTSDGDTPPRSAIPVKLPTSAVKERVQQFEELASGGSGSGGARLTRTKTRALSKQNAEKEKISPRDEVDKSKYGMLTATIEKLKNLPQKYNPLSLSASKPPNNIVTSVKSFLPTPTVKPTLQARQEEKRQEERERDKEDARKKKEALLEAKREEQRRRRENKMAAAAAARDAQVRERTAQLQARERAWQDKQTHVDLGKAEKLKQAEKKRLLLEKKAAETEERRRAEETARLARLEEERRKAEAVRQRQQEEAERIRREEQKNEREMQLARQQYMERLQQKKLENMHTPLSTGGTPCKMAPVHMADGFQYLNSDSEDESKHMPTPDWSRMKARNMQLRIQDMVSTLHIDKLFSVRRHTPDLAELFPSIDRKLFKRTSSAVWRTPPPLPPSASEH